MDKKFLNKVVDQIVRETIIDYESKRFDPPFTRPSFFPPHLSSIPFTTINRLDFHSSITPFIKHCREVYGLNDDEIEYVWKEYTKIIADKIENG